MNKQIEINLKKKKKKLSMLVYTCNPSTQEAEGRISSLRPVWAAR
jgi:hypothetical protein